ncbi:MAG: uncharacterized protein JWM74_2686 [Myxococcaceae bacterium]|nr:uncharacterized protein [Myxococcaceae bacterium]
MGPAMRTLALLLLVLVPACGGESPPPKTEEATRPQGDGPAKPVSPSVEVINTCATAVHAYVGETPNGTTGSHMELRGGGTSHLARDPDGTLTFWIEDDKGFGLAHVKVTRRMRKVEIGASCGTLHAE